MIPLRDTTRSRNYPVVNTLLIAANVLLFLVQSAQGPQEDAFIYTYGLVPARYSVPGISAHFTSFQQALALLSFMFLHGGFWHLLGNMWSLYIFGDNVEDRLGPFRYLLFYLLCGWASGLFHLFLNWQSPVPTIGASGAIAGVMGAYLILYPHSRILTLIPILFIPYFIEIPAYFFLGLWFLFQFLGAAGSDAQGGGIAWWAHVGGFVAGIILVKILERVPQTGLTERMREATQKTGTPRLQVAPVHDAPEDPHLYGTITVSPKEAFLGTRKLISVKWGMRSRILRVTVPPRLREGTVLRLVGLGKVLPDGKKGDLHLKVLIKDEG
jgi:membrane associated rhomboid family serine protease